MFPSGHKNSAGEAGTDERPRPGKDLWPPGASAARGPLRETDAAAQADQAGSHVGLTADRGFTKGGRLARPRQFDESNSSSNSAVMSRDAPWSPPIVDIGDGAVGHLLARGDAGPGRLLAGMDLLGAHGFLKFP